MALTHRARSKQRETPLLGKSFILIKLPSAPSIRLSGFNSFAISLVSTNSSEVNLLLGE